MRPHGNRIGTTNGGRAADDFAFGTHLRPTFGNDDDADCLGARMRSRNRPGAKKWSIEVEFRCVFTGEPIRYRQHYGTKRGAEQAAERINGRQWFSARVLPD